MLPPITYPTFGGQQSTKNMQRKTRIAVRHGSPMDLGYNAPRVRANHEEENDHRGDLNLISFRDSRRGDSRQQKQIKIGPRGVKIRIRSVRFIPKGFDKIANIIFAIFGYSGESGVLPGCSQSDLTMIPEKLSN